MKQWSMGIYLVVHFLSFLLSCFLGPRRGHGLLVSAFGGFVLGPANLILIYLLTPSSRTGKASRDLEVTNSDSHQGENTTKLSR